MQAVYLMTQNILLLMKFQTQQIWNFKILGRVTQYERRSIETYTNVLDTVRKVLR